MPNKKLDYEALESQIIRILSPKNVDGVLKQEEKIQSEITKALNDYYKIQQPKEVEKNPHRKNFVTDAQTAVILKRLFSKHLIQKNGDKYSLSEIALNGIRNYKQPETNNDFVIAILQVLSIINELQIQNYIYTKNNDMQSLQFVTNYLISARRRLDDLFDNITGLPEEDYNYITNCTFYYQKHYLSQKIKDLSVLPPEEITQILLDHSIFISGFNLTSDSQGSDPQSNSSRSKVSQPKKKAIRV